MSDGHVSSGMPGKQNTNKNCRHDKFGQLYAREAVFAQKTARAYCIYLPQTLPLNGDGTRHDWACVILWFYLDELDDVFSTKIGHLDRDTWYIRHHDHIQFYADIPDSFSPMPGTARSSELPGEPPLHQRVTCPWSTMTSFPRRQRKRSRSMISKVDHVLYEILRALSSICSAMLTLMLSRKMQMPLVSSIAACWHTSKPITFSLSHREIFVSALLLLAIHRRRPQFGSYCLDSLIILINYNFDDSS
ncbi:hypothetical protein MRB53_039148 [Persea americana]|nr:hypothetical protein MRB53_039148 [Persea americana]